MKQDVVIFGTGGLAKELIGYLEDDPRYNVAYCVSSKPFNNDSYAKQYHVEEALPPLSRFSHLRFIVAVAEQHLRRKFVYDQYELGNGDRFIGYVHPSAIVSKHAQVAGSILCAQSIVVGDAKLGEFCFLNTNATVGHDTYVGAFSTLHPNSEVCGFCEIGEGLELGIGSYVLPHHRLGPHTRVSAGSVVRHDFPDGMCTLQGNPAVKRGKTHTVKEGETLTSIAEHYFGNGSRWVEIATVNNLADPDFILPGKVLVLP